MNQLLVIEDIAVRHNNDGCYCLNDLHQAAIVSGLNAMMRVLISASREVSLANAISAVIE